MHETCMVNKMKIIFDILRRSDPEEKPFWQKIPYETDDMRETVATALTRINEAACSSDAGAGCDVDGIKIRPIRWESSCLQKKCGACAMVISGRPRLACDTFLKDYVKKDSGGIRLEPLSSFPVVADLLVDRSILSENLKTLRVWHEKSVSPVQKTVPDAWDASRCLQCGCCLEACPNFCPGGTFFGAAGIVPVARLLIEAPAEQRARLREEYKTHIYNGCGKSLACENICPAGIDINRLLSKSNAIAVWRIHG